VAKYTIGQLKGAVHDACPNQCSNMAIAIMVAISLAENPGMDSATNSPPNRDGSIDRGPFQINSRAHADVSDACAHDLACSAKAAYRISNGFHTFTPWTTYTSGAYKSKMDAAVKAVPGAQSDNTQGSGVLGSGIGPDVLPGASDAVPGAISDTAGAIVKLANVIEHTVESLFQASLWFRVGKVIVGLFLGGLALTMLAKRQGIDVGKAAELATVV
jgi:hypothetical protein